MKVPFVLSVAMLATSIVVASGRTPGQAQTAKPPAAQAASPATAMSMSDAELEKIGEPLVTKVCTKACHGIEEIEAMRRSRTEWNVQVREMINKGAEATPADQALIKKYLTRYYGFVTVNTAAADEIAEVLGLSAKDASAIVAYRTANGKFADVDALKKVPGIDLAKIDEQPAALRFK
ncbi:MAG TPA: helix-hairpin-helix domain-containing protein [Vicinamibacterales bacterium]|nr:helix-hairpin-helix domain-containing protein [Vicinamibacterales bacterium]